MVLYNQIKEESCTQFGYCGEYQDLCSGLIYLRNRYYDPNIGRFITEYPARDGLNWYVYCRNNHVNIFAPTGYITQKEMDIYEKVEIAPMAYTYLMSITYNWYLTNDEIDKAIYHQLPDNLKWRELEF